VVLVGLVVLVVSVVAACGEDPGSGVAVGLSRAEAIERIDAVCRRSVGLVRRVGPEPSIGAGSRLALDRYGRWHARAGAVVEAGLRQIERLAIPDDARKGEIRAYVYFSRLTISKGRGVLRAAQVGDDAGGEQLLGEMESDADQAGFAARRYGLHECGA